MSVHTSSFGFRLVSYVPLKQTVRNTPDTRKDRICSILDSCDSRDKLLFTSDGSGCICVLWTPSSILHPAINLFGQSVCIYCINLSVKFTFLPVPKPYTNKFCVRRQCTGIYLSYHFVIIHIDKVTSIAAVAEICL